MPEDRAPCFVFELHVLESDVPANAAYLHAAVRVLIFRALTQNLVHPVESGPAGGSGNPQ